MHPRYCRFCNENLVDVFVDLGMSPLANSFLTSDMLKTKENFYPLQTFVCNKCFLVQLEEFESPNTIFTNYAYFASYSETWLEHSKNYVNMMIDKFGCNSNSQVIEIASNDGYLLQYFKEKGISVLGIEPAENVAKVAQQKGIPTIIKFFGTEIAKKLVEEDKQADLLLGNNVLAHVPNLNDFVSGMRILLKSKGIITMEFPHLLQLMKQKQFDTIYHEHFSYFSLFVVQKIFSFHKLIIFNVEELQTHGGSLRVYVKHLDNNDIPINKEVNNLIEKEKQFGLDNLSTYADFQEQVNIMRQNICKFFDTVKKNGKTIVGYGAPAKGNTLLNYCNISLDLLSYTVDKNPHKQELFLPGTHIPIEEPEKINQTKPDYLLILPWNLKDEIMTQMKYIRVWGGKFVTLIPEVKIY